MKDKKLIALDLYDTCIHHPKNLGSYRKIFEDSDITKETVHEIRNILQKTPINIEDANFDIPKEVISDINDLTEKNIKGTKLYHDTIDTLQTLKDRGYKIAIVSNLAQKYEKPLRNLFPSGIIDYEVLSFKVGELKPNPGIFEYLKDISGVDYKNMVMIGDKLDIDVAGAQNVGMDAIQIDRAMKGGNIRYEKDYIKISTLSDLLKILK